MPDFLRPPGLFPPPNYSHVVVTQNRAAGRTIYVAGQVGVDERNEPVSLEFQGQAERAFLNLQTALKAVGAGFKDVVKVTLFLRNATDVPALRELLTKHFGTERPPANTLLIVHALARPYLLFEIEAIAVLE
jgi:enamine deaminase RidA (YjgF/YER057c/UK114 family)